MTDLQFDHTKDDILGALTIKKTDLKKFFIDVEEHMSGHKCRHSEALDFIWASEQSFEMKIAATFSLGGMVGLDLDEERTSPLKAIPLRVLKDLFKEMQKDGLL